jgi:hypothetical protein
MLQILVASKGIKTWDIKCITVDTMVRLLCLHMMQLHYSILEIVHGRPVWIKCCTGWCWIRRQWHRKHKIPVLGTAAGIEGLKFLLTYYSWQGYTLYILSQRSVLSSCTATPLFLIGAHIKKNQIMQLITPLHITTCREQGHTNMIVRTIAESPYILTD